MQEWMIAMLVISILLIVRDMAKTILAGQIPKKEEKFALCESHPQKEKVERYAASFQKLAETFYGMPYRKEYLSAGQVEVILSDASGEMCSHCYHREICWGENAGALKRGGEAMIRAMEEGNEEEVETIRAEWAQMCCRSVQYLEAVRESFKKEKQNLIWNNRMIESRLAVAQQLTETARIMETVAEDLYDIAPADPGLWENIRRSLKKRHIVLKNAWVMDKVEGRRQMFLTMRARSGQCVSVTEVAQMLSGLCECAMTSAEDSRCIVNGEYHTVHFVDVWGGQTYQRRRKGFWR